jgi:hypothetical protein
LKYCIASKANGVIATIEVHIAVKTATDVITISPKNFHHNFLIHAPRATAAAKKRDAPIKARFFGLLSIV